MKSMKIIFFGILMIALEMAFYFDLQLNKPEPIQEISPYPGLYDSDENDRFEKVFNINSLPLEQLTGNGKNGSIIKTAGSLNVFQFGIAAVDNVDGDSFYINRSGKNVFNKTFERAGYFDESGLAAVKSDGKYGYINTKGEYVISPKYDYAERFYNGFAKVVDNGIMQVIDKKGNVVYQPKKADWFQLRDNFNADSSDTGDKNSKIDLSEQIKQFSHDRYPYVYNDKVGFRDGNNNIVISPRFVPVYAIDGTGGSLYLNTDYYNYSKDGYVFCFGEDDNYLVDRNGKIIFKMKDLPK